MPTHISPIAVVIFLLFVGFVLGLSFYLGRKAKTAGGYFAAHGEIGWFVNGMAFAGDYLSAASFLGICGMIAFYGFDGFLYSIGFLAGWVVALFVIAEPIKRLGRYTFADALDAKFNSRGIRLAAAISTLVVSMFYLVPQMVGAGSLIKPLLGIEHYWGVLIVGGIVIFIVTTAGMVSTTWVQFIKGSLLVIFCTFLVAAILHRGVRENYAPDTAAFDTVAPGEAVSHLAVSPSPARSGLVIKTPKAGSTATGPFGFIKQIHDSTLAKKEKQLPDGRAYLAMYDGDTMLLPGNYFKGIRAPELSKKLDFVSLMLALFCGTASLPHILIRYYTVKDAAAARKSTVVGIIAIGFFYMLTLYIGLGAMVSGNLDPTDSNMAAPLLARTFGELPFALITGIAFTTVLGTVSGLIIASSGAVAHDLAGIFSHRQLTGHEQVRVAKIASVAVGIVAVLLGIAAKNFNVGFLVGWAFNVAASANLPAIACLLFWKGTTKQGMVASISAGLGSSVLWLLLTDAAFHDLYHLPATVHGWAPFSQPALVTVPLAFVVLVLVSLVTKQRREPQGFAVTPA